MDKNVIERENFIFHLDVLNEEISLQNFIKISDALEKTCVTITNLLFETKNCQIILKPIEKGSLKLFYTIVVIGILLPMVPDTMNGIIHEYTGKDWSHYAGKTARAITDTVVGIFKANSTQLKKTERMLSDDKKLEFDKIIKIQSDFYISLEKDKNIKGVGFDENNLFPIQRKDFSLHVCNDIERDLEPNIALKNLVIYKSLNVDEDGKWEFVDKYDKKHFSASIDDEYFKKNFLSGKTPLKRSKNDDEIKALVQYDKKVKNGSISTPNIIIKEVYYFNNRQLRDIPMNLVDDLLIPQYKDDAQGELF